MVLQQNKDEKAYSFRKYKGTNETHIFEGHFTPTACKTGRYSVCEKVDRNTDDMVDVQMCLNEEEARKRAAAIGRRVCGVCISHLYTTY